MKAFLLLTPDASRKSAILGRILRWSTEGVHRAMDVECSADETHWNCCRLQRLRHPAGLGSDQQSTTRELAQDVQELSTSSAWGSGDCNGDAVTCWSTCAGAVRLKSHTIKTRLVDRQEARVHFWYENRTDDVNSEARGVVADDNAKDTADQEYQVGVP